MKKLFTLITCAVFAMSAAAQDLSIYDKNQPIGWGNVDTPITGSNDENPVIVTTQEEFVAAFDKNDKTAKKTIYIKGTINVGGQFTIQNQENKTIYGLPGSAFVNDTQSDKTSESGILYLKGCKNIVMRNVTFKGAGAFDIDGNDNLTVDACEHIWIDHCDFQDGVDGNFDCKNGSDYVSVTWCRFRYLLDPRAGGSGGSNDHRFSNLWGSGDGTAAKDEGHLRTTFANCWWDDGCKERMPRIRFGQVHILNCLYSSKNNNCCIGAGYRCNAYVEKSVFVSQKNPWKCYATSNGYTDYNITVTDCVGAKDAQERSGDIAYFNPSDAYQYEGYDKALVQNVVTNAETGAGATLTIEEGQPYVPTYAEASNDLAWDYSEKQIPTEGPDNGLYYAAYVNDAPSNNMKLNGVKLNSSGYAFFEKAAVAGKLTLTFSNRKTASAYAVNVYACTIANGTATKGDLIGEIAINEGPGSGSLDIAADVTGIYIERKTAAEGVLQKIVFKETKARNFVDFEITNEQMSKEFDPSTLPAGVTFNGTQRNDSHGYGNVTITVPVDGTVKFTIGGCQYANPATCKVTNAAGELLAEPNLKTANCYHSDRSSTIYIYTGSATTLTFSNIAYLPYFKAEATEVSEVTVTYKDQDGNPLGTKKFFEGDAIGEVPYTEADLTIPEGYKFRGWVYTSGIKVQPTDVVTDNISVLASVTAIETPPTVGSVQTYDLTSATFYPEDHETFSVADGKYYNNHGFDFAAGGSFSVDVAGKAQVVLTLCQYGSGTTIEAKDADGNIIKCDLAAKSEADGGASVLTYDGKATRLTFTFASQTYLHAVTVYNVTDFMQKDEASGYYIVPAGDAASLVMALNIASGEKGAKVFLPDGTYDLGEAVKTPVSGNNVSLIGQSAEKTVIVTAPPVAIEGLGSADLLVNTGDGLYIQDITLKNALDYYSAGSAGRAAVLHDKGSKTVCKNVCMLSYQDTYYSHQTGGLYYFEGGEIHGTVDYMCGIGRVYFNGVSMVNEKSKEATMSANSELYVFNNCTVKQSEATTFNFGRAWSNTPVCVWLNTTLEEPAKLVSTRWRLEGINVDYKVAGEYGTKNAAGEDITPASNTVVFKKANTELETILDASALETYAIDKVLGDWAATAQNEAKQADAPADAAYNNGTVTWSASNGATAYALFKNGILAGITTGSSFSITVDPEHDSLTIRAANARGGFGIPAAVIGTNTAISDIRKDKSADTIYNLNGLRVDKPSKGIYIVNGKKVIM